MEELVAGYAIVTLPQQMIPAFSQIEEIEFIEKPKRVFAQVETSLAASCFEQVLNPQQTQGALRGEGVYVAIIDSGIDYTLPQFRDTDGRTKIDLIGLANQVETMVEEFPLDIKVAVMGCVVNGPGEAKEADIGIAGGIGEGLLIKKGQIIKKIPEDKLLEELRYELMNWNA